MDDRHLIWCGPGNPPKGADKQFRQVVRLDTFPKRGNVFLRFENISKKLAQNIPSIAMDFLEIGSYVYCADQSVTRGGLTWPRDGKTWIRNFVFDIPVRNPDIWNSPEVKDNLTDTLSYLSDDNYEFNFRKLTEVIPTDGYFDFEAGNPWFDAEDILLFSGGLDSMAGTIEEVVNRQRRVVLVSHRPVAKISTWQLNLLSDFKRLTNVGERCLHVPVWVNKDKALTRETSQRTRSFLYVMLAACLAHMHKLNLIKIYENGIVSTNLPLSEQVVGARASRSTHPKVLHGYSQLLSGVLGGDFSVINPFYWKTKSDIVQVFKDYRLTELVRATNSCIHTRASDIASPHCGMCSQCIERRVATLYCDIGEDDPEELYRKRLFLYQPESPQDKAMLISYFNHTKLLECITAEEFFQKFGEAHRVLNHLGLNTSEAAKKLFDLHRRHGQQVCAVIEKQIKENAGIIRKGKLRPDSLLAILIEQPKKKRASDTYQRFPTPEGTKWENVLIEIISRESVRITANGISRRYTALDMGFRDKRKVDLPNKQWDLLLAFAQTDGVLDWSSPHSREKLYKSIQLLKRTLRSFFQINEPPIKTYKKRQGYIAKFKIIDSSFHP